MFREHVITCFIDDAAGVRNRDLIGIDNITWECDDPHSDSVWPDAPEQIHREMAAAGCSDEDMHKITWQNTCRFFDYDPFAVVPREQATVGALRALSPDVDTSTRSRHEWRERYLADGRLTGLDRQGRRVTRL